MAQSNSGTVAVTNGSPNLVGTGTTWLTDSVAAGHGFTIIDSGVVYTIATVTDNTHATLSANYAGTTASGLSYTIFKDFTNPDSIPELNKGDIETATIFTRAMRVIQGLFTQFKTLISSTTTHNFTSDGDYTLTSTQELYGRIVLTDTTPVLTTARNVIVSTTARGHWFVNNTLQTIKIKTSAGTGINLTPGMSRYYIGDGTNVVEGDNSVTTMPFSFRNKIINGNFDFWDYATSQTSVGYGSDNRWYNNHSGSTKTTSRQTFTLGQTDVPNNPTYYNRTVVTSSAGASNYVIKQQRIEKVSTLAGKTITVTFYAKADASKNIAIEFTQNFGTTGSPSASVTGIGIATCALTTSWQKFTVTTKLPSISGKTLGTDGNDYLQLLFWFDAGSDYNSRTNSLGQQSGTFDIAQVQLEEGSVATPFEQRPMAIERELCERYFEKSYDASVSPGSVNNAGAISIRSVSTDALMNIRYKTKKRASPTVTIYSPVTGASGNLRNIDGASDAVVTGLFSGEDAITITATVTAGQHVQAHYTASAEL